MQASEAYEIIQKPILTEKSTSEQERANVYRFEVAGGANRIEQRRLAVALAVAIGDLDVHHVIAREDIVVPAVVAVVQHLRLHAADAGGSVQSTV